MASVEELLVRIDASTEQLRREMKAADKSVSDFQRGLDKSLSKIDAGFGRLDKMASNVVRSFGAIGGALSIAGLTRFVSSTLTAADELAKMSQQIGVSAETLQIWDFAATQSGVTSEKLASSVERLTKRVGEARAGTGEFAKVAAELGINLADTESVFDQVADAIANAADEQDQARIATAAFGREGLSLVRMLRDGSGGIEEFATEARRLGIVLSGENLAKAEKIGDEIDKLNRIVRVNMQEGLLAGLTGDLDSLSDAITPEMAEGFRDLGEAIGEAFSWLIEHRDAVVTSIEMIGGAIAGRLVASLVTANPLLRAFGAAAGALATQADDETRSRVGLAFNEANRRAFGVSDLRSEIGADVDLLRALPDDEELARLEKLAVEVQAMTAPAEELELALIGVYDRIVELRLGASAANPMVIKITKSLGEMGEGSSKAAAGSDKTAKKLQSLLAQYDEGAAYLQKYGKAQADLKTLYDAGIISLDEYTDMLLASQDALDGVAGEVAQVDAAMSSNSDVMSAWTETMRTAIERLDDIFADMWRNVIDGTRSSFDAIKDMFKNLLAELAHQAFTRPIVVSLSGALGLSGSAGASGASGVGGSGGLSNLTWLFGGNSMGLAISDIASSLSTSSMLSGTSVGNWLGGVSGNAGAFSNLMYGGVGLAGGFIGDKLFGGYGGMGGSTGAMLGLAVGGPIGALIGGLSGGAFGGLFGGDKTDPRVQLASNQHPGAYEDDVYRSTAFGTIGYGGSSHGMKAGDEQWGGILDYIALLDDAVASMMQDSEIAAATDALAGYAGEKRDLSGLTDEKMARLIADRLSIVVEDMMGAAGGMLRSVMETFSGSTEGLGEVIAAIGALDAQLSVNVWEQYSAALDDANRTATAAYRDQNQLVRDLAASMDLSAESITAVTVANADRMQMEAQLLAMIDQAVLSVSGTLGRTIESITLDLLDQEGKYERMRSQAESLAADLSSMTDPGKISATVAEIDRLTNAAYGMLDDTQQAAMGEEFLAFLQDVQSLSESQLDEARQNIVDQSAVMRDVIESAMYAAADRFSAAAVAMQNAANTMQAAASTPVVVRVESAGAEVVYA